MQETTHDIGILILNNQSVGYLHHSKTWADATSTQLRLYWNYLSFPDSWFPYCVAALRLSYIDLVLPVIIKWSITQQIIKKVVIFTPCVFHSASVSSLCVCGPSSKRLRDSSGNLKPRWVSPVHEASPDTNTSLNASKFDVKRLFYH